MKEHKAQKTKRDLDKIELYQAQRRFLSAKQKAGEQIKQFLGIHYYTSEPFGLVF